MSAEKRSTKLLKNAFWAGVSMQLLVPASMAAGLASAFAEEASPTREILVTACNTGMSAFLMAGVYMVLCKKLHDHYKVVEQEQDQQARQARIAQLHGRGPR